MVGCLRKVIGKKELQYIITPKRITTALFGRGGLLKKRKEVERM